MNRSSAVFLILAALPVSAAVAPAKPATLTVKVTGLHSTSGKLIACLWSEKKGFPSCTKSKTASKLVLPVTGTSMNVAFSGVAPGKYAVTIHHDENGDGKMQRKFMMMPKEGVGISNNPGGMPGFSESLVDVGPGSAITIRMRYLFD